jgi:hypothetical protein
VIEAGKKAAVSGTVLRVDGERVDLQTPDGRLIQTHISNVEAVKEPPAKNDGENKGKRRNPIAAGTR